MGQTLHHSAFTQSLVYPVWLIYHKSTANMIMYTLFLISQCSYQSAQRLPFLYQINQSQKIGTQLPVKLYVHQIKMQQIPNGNVNIYELSRCYTLETVQVIYYMFTINLRLRHTIGVVSTLI